VPPVASDGRPAVQFRAHWSWLAGLDCFGRCAASQ
jgi:hypothetical protein